MLLCALPDRLHPRSPVNSRGDRTWTRRILFDLQRTISKSPSRRGLLTGLVSGASTHIPFDSANSSAKQQRHKKKKKKSPRSDQPCICDPCPAAPCTPTCVCDVCPAAPCIPKCEGRVCGDDGCGGICGVACLEHEECREGTCVCAPGTEICPRGDHVHCFPKCGAQQIRDFSTCLCCQALGAPCAPDAPGGCCGSWACKRMCADNVTPCQSDTECVGNGLCGSGICVR